MKLKSFADTYMSTLNGLTHRISRDHERGLLSYEQLVALDSHCQTFAKGVRKVLTPQEEGGADADHKDE